MKKIFNVKLNKKIIIISSIVLAFIICSIVFLIPKGKNEVVNNVVNKKGYALDNETAQATLYQPIIESDIKFKVYGEISKGLNLSGYDGRLRIKTNCNIGLYDESNLEEDNKKEVVEENKEYALGDSPVEINNHCIIYINDTELNGFDYSSPYDYENHKFLQRLYQTAYIELPDGSLISLISYGGPIMQVNIYDNETRIVLEDGSAYFRIVKQEKNKVFTVQVGDKVFRTTGKTEFFATTNAFIASLNQSNEDISKLIDEFIVAAKADKSWKDDISGTLSVFNGSFELIKGTGTISDRGSSKTEKLKKEKYEFIYYFAKHFEEGKTTRTGNVINVTEPSLKEYYTSIGYYEKTRGVWGISSNVYDSLDYQLSLNNLNLNIDKIITKEENVSDIMPKYLAYYKEQVTKRLAEKKEAQTAYIKKRQEELKEELKTCKNDNYYYVPEANGCCPNGYGYDASKNECINYSCDVGSYNVGVGCCPNGSYLSEDKKSCITPSKQKETPSYFPSNSSGGNSDTCVDFGTATAQLFCPGGNPGNHAYKSNGKCCIKSDINEPNLEKIE